jgi:hypothetical protein
MRVRRGQTVDVVPDELSRRESGRREVAQLSFGVKLAAVSGVARVAASR